MKLKNLLSLCAILVFSISLIVFAQNKIDITKIPNGKYLGLYNAKYKDRKGDYKAVVTVENGKLTSIVLTQSAHKSGPQRGKEAFDKMIAANNIDADGVTGATWKGLVTDALTKLTPVK